MRKLSAFNFLTLNGYFEGPAKGDISWHRHGGEEGEYSKESLKAGNMLLFGRVTYEMMAGYWPTPMAAQNDPIVAKGMNEANKLVFSRSLEKASWSNTTIVKGHICDEIRKIKQTPGPNMTILGSGSIITQFADEGLIDEYQFMIDPVAIGAGTPVFSYLKNKLDLTLISSRVFSSGVILVTYEPLKK
jgi:dihydrofolate reductase